MRSLCGLISVVPVCHQVESEYHSVPVNAHSLAYYVYCTSALSTHYLPNFEARHLFSNDHHTRNWNWNKTRTSTPVQFGATIDAILSMTPIFWIHRPLLKHRSSVTFDWYIVRSYRRFQITNFRQNRYVFNSDTGENRLLEHIVLQYLSMDSPSPHRYDS